MNNNAEVREILPRDQRKLQHGVCYWCGADPEPPSQLIPISRHHWTNSIVLALRRPCCHSAVNTECFGTVIDYLSDGWKRAETICRLYNESVGAPVEPPRERPKSFIALDPTKG